jgi:hypothetical protein
MLSLFQRSIADIFATHERDLAVHPARHRTSIPRAAALRSLTSHTFWAIAQK